MKPRAAWAVAAVALISLGLLTRRAAPPPVVAPDLVLSAPTGSPALPHAVPDASPAPLAGAPTPAQAPAPAQPAAPAFSHPEALGAQGDGLAALAPTPAAPSTKPAFAPPKLRPTNNLSSLPTGEPGDHAVYYQNAQAQPQAEAAPPAAAPRPAAAPAAAPPPAPVLQRPAPRTRFHRSANTGEGAYAAPQTGTAISNGGPTRESKPVPSRCPTNAAKPLPYDGEIFLRAPRDPEPDMRLAMLPCSQPGRYYYALTNIGDDKARHRIIQTPGQEWRFEAFAPDFKPGQTVILESRVPIDVVHMNVEECALPGYAAPGCY